MWIPIFFQSRLMLSPSLLFMLFPFCGNNLLSLLTSQLCLYALFLFLLVLQVYFLFSQTVKFRLLHNFNNWLIESSFVVALFELFKHKSYHEFQSRIERQKNKSSIYYDFNLIQETSNFMVFKRGKHNSGTQNFISLITLRSLFSFCLLNFWGCSKVTTQVVTYNIKVSSRVSFPFSAQIGVQS